MILNDDTFIQVAMRNYNNPQCHSIEEFNDDLKIFNQLNKIFYRYNDRKQINEMLLVNKIITCFNLFGVATVDLLLFKINKEYRIPLITTLKYLNRLPDFVAGVDCDLTDDLYLLNLLKKKI